MRIKKIFVIIIARAVRGVGMGLGSAGLLMAAWFFFFSVNAYNYLFGILSLLETALGFYIFKFSLDHIHDEQGRER